MTQASTPRPVFDRADQVGSLLRPQYLLDAWEQNLKGQLSSAELTAVQDRAILDAVRRQEQIGFQSISDGEFRRDVWFEEFFRGISGIAIRAEPAPDWWSDPESVKHPPLRLRTSGKLARTGSIMGRAFEFLRDCTQRTPKITIPAPTRLHFQYGVLSLDPKIYPDEEEFWDDVVAIYQQEIADLEARGCTRIQVDDPMLTLFVDAGHRVKISNMGLDPDQLLLKYLSVLNRCLAKRKRSTWIGLHICRGNSRSKGVASGGYERIAPTVFPMLEVDSYLLEFDDARSGGFAPLDFVPRDRQVILGLVTSKTGTLESPDDLKRRVAEASRHMPFEMLALSPQCGFASIKEGNLITAADQWAKLELVVGVARDLWGGK